MNKYGYNFPNFFFTSSIFLSITSFGHPTCRSFVLIWPGSKLFNSAILLGKSGEEEITAEELAKKVGTINYEITTRINPLIKRMIRWRIILNMQFYRSKKAAFLYGRAKNQYSNPYFKSQKNIESRRRLVYNLLLISIAFAAWSYFLFFSSFFKIIDWDIRGLKGYDKKDVESSLKNFLGRVWGE